MTWQRGFVRFFLFFRHLETRFLSHTEFLKDFPIENCVTVKEKPRRIKGFMKGNTFTSRPGSRTKIKTCTFLLH